ncbi:isoprenylcysteine carboxylmethyltransferase family protein [uncultured Desulfobacter sp.]|uniref:methyltransferase family protein n=1 Tax=uncultured Desulfobacter sp. TaxID=240139 RepID=UPI0029F4BE6F|nr:isoprenylcysteine carboxylmethyltransferase family protein [uncultured Desulfobacter sp.]
MISPFGLYYYSFYGFPLRALSQYKLGSFLTGFFLPHFTRTSSPLISLLQGMGWPLLWVGLVLFTMGFIQIYGSKFISVLNREKRYAGPVDSWLYGNVRHPQYVALAVAGLGALLVWPRFLVLFSYVTMFFLYYSLARFEEHRCSMKFGEEYRQYLDNTNMFLPFKIYFPSLEDLIPSRNVRVCIYVSLYSMAILASFGIGERLKKHTVESISAIYLPETAIVSPARLEPTELEDAFRLATNNPNVKTALNRDDTPASWLVYVVPKQWYIPELPLGIISSRIPHKSPRDFNRNQLSVLFTKPLSHAQPTGGKEILLSAYGFRPVVAAEIDLAENNVLKVTHPPATLAWGKIPTPLL